MFWKNDLFKKVAYTLGILIIYRVVMLIVIPGINLEIIGDIIEQSTFLKTLNMFAGGSIERCSILAVNIMPYMQATLIVQLLSSNSGLEYFKKLKLDKEIGIARLNQWTQYFTLIISFICALYFSSFLYSFTPKGVPAVYISKYLFYTISISILCAGSLAMVWLSNQLTKIGLINQGTSLIMFANVAGSIWLNCAQIIDFFKIGVLNYTSIFIIALFLIILASAVLFVEMCKREIPVSFPGLQLKNEIVLPLKINNAGIVPSIFVSAIVHVPQLLMSICKKFGWFTDAIDKYITYVTYGGSFYFIFNAIMLFIFTITQTELVFDTEEIARSLQQNGIIIVNVRPGYDTMIYIKNILNNLNIVAGIYLVIVCTGVDYFCQSFNSSVGVRVLSISGTSILILIGTAMNIWRGLKNYNVKGIMEDLYKV